MQPSQPCGVWYGELPLPFPVPSQSRTDRMIESVLGSLGARLIADGEISIQAESSGVYLKTEKGRIRFESRDGWLLYSGPIQEKTIRNFFARYWHRRSEA